MTAIRCWGLGVQHFQQCFVGVIVKTNTFKVIGNHFENQVVLPHFRILRFYLPKSKKDVCKWKKLINANCFNIHVNVCTINRVSELKYLGVTFDEYVNWNAHVKYVMTKAGKRIGMLSRIRNNITVYCANIIYTSFIHPIFDYCDTIYHCCGEVNSELLEKLQRRAAHIVCKSYDSDTAMISLKWGTLISTVSASITLLVLSKSVSVVVAHNFL